MRSVNVGQRSLEIACQTESLTCGKVSLGWQRRGVKRREIGHYPSGVGVIRAQASGLCHGGPWYPGSQAKAAVIATGTITVGS